MEPFIQFLPKKQLATSAWGSDLASCNKPSSQMRLDQDYLQIIAIFRTPNTSFSYPRLLVRRARKMAQDYQLMYGEPIPTAQLVQRVAMVMQEYTQSGGVRPFGVSLLIAGWDEEEQRPYLFQCDPSGAYFAWKATALGKNYINGKTFLEKR